MASMVADVAVDSCDDRLRKGKWRVGYMAIL
jgi:hypothetical protein